VLEPAETTPVTSKEPMATKPEESMAMEDLEEPVATKPEEPVRSKT